MHSHEALLQKLYSCLKRKDHAGMAECYHPDAEFQDIAFTLKGRKSIHAMWHMISTTDLRAEFKVQHADERSGTVHLVDDYTFKDTGRPVHNVIQSEFQFRDGLIIRHHDKCNALRWGIQALGPVKGVLSWLVPNSRRAKAKEKLDAFIRTHPEYRASTQPTRP
jgi:ketosteroid isomerase-like protein